MQCKIHVFEKCFKYCKRYLSIGTWQCSSENIYLENYVRSSKIYAFTRTSYIPVATLVDYLSFKPQTPVISILTHLLNWSLKIGDCTIREYHVNVFHYKIC